MSPDNGSHVSEQDAGTAPRSTRRRWILLAATIVVAAAAVRLMFIRAGLPGLNMASPDEGTVVPKSVRLLTSGTNFNPRWFLYPSGYMMALAGLVTLMRPFVSPGPGLEYGGYLDIMTNPDKYMLAGRAISVVAGIVLVITTYLIATRICGKRWALAAAALIALSPLAVMYSHFAVTDMAMTALLGLAVWRTIVASSTNRFRDVLIGVALLGLAVSFKYNAGLFLIPTFAWLLVRQTPSLGRRLMEMFAAGTVALASFLVGTPYALLDWKTFKRDLLKQNDIQNDGWLGYEATPSGFIVNITPNLTSALGAVALILVVVGIVAGLRRHSTADLLLWPYVIGTYIYISRWNANFDRYLLPILPILAVAAAFGARQLWESVPAPWRRPAPAVAVVVALLAQPAIGTVKTLNHLSQPEYRLDALPQIYAMIPSGTHVAYEPLTPPFLRQGIANRLSRIDGKQRTHYWGVIVYPPQPGIKPHRLRDICRLKKRDLEWVMTSDDIERRVRAAGSRYPLAVKYYDDLLAHADVKLVVPPGLGPGAKVWKLRNDFTCPLKDAALPG